MATQTDNVNLNINIDASNANKSTDSLKSKIRELQKEMQKLAMVGKQNTEEYKRLANEAGRLTDIIGDVAQDTKNLANDNQKLAASIQGVGAGVAVFSSLQSVAAMLGVEDEKLLKTMQKIQAVQLLLNSLNTIANALNKNSALMTLLRTQRTAQLNTELEENTVVTEEAAEATDTYTKSEQGAAKGAKTLSTGIKGVGSAMKSVAVIAIISAAVAGLMKLIEKYNETREEQRKLYEEHQNAIADFEKKVNETASKTIAKYNVLSTAFSRLNGDIKEQQKFIQQHKTDFDELGMSINSVEDAENALIKNKEAFVEAQLAKAKAMAAQSTLEDLMKQRLELQKQREDANKLGEVLQNIYSQYDNSGQVIDKTAKSTSDANKEIDAQIADIDNQVQQLIDDILNFTPTVTTTTTKAVKDTGDAIEKLKNEVLLAEKQMNVNATKEWSEERLKAEKELNEAQKQIASQALEERLKNTKLSEEEKKVLRLKLEEEYQLKEIALVEKYDEKKKEIKAKDDEKKKENERKEIDSAQRTEKAKLDARLLALNEGSEEYFEALKQQAQQEYNIAMEEFRRQLEDKLISQEEYNAQVELLEKQKADKIKQINKDALAQEQTQRQEYIQQIGEIAAQTSALVTDMMETELEGVEQGSKKEKQIRKKYAVAEATMQIADIGISTAQSIMGAWESASKLAYPLNIVIGTLMSVMLGMTGLAQTAKAIQAKTQIMKASRGMYISGRSHANGGEMIEAEGGEVIMSKRAVRAYGGLLSQMNSSVGGVRFPQAESNGSVIQTTINPNDLRTIVTEVVAGTTAVPVVVSERSITDSQARAVSISSYARI